MKVLAAVFNPKKMHIYDVKTTGKRPVHLIEAGKYLTEEDLGEGYWNSGMDMGWFFLNQREYDYFKTQLKDIEIKYDK